jgi:serralysin
MTNVSTYAPTGDPYVDGILTGLQWATSSLTYSFPTDAADYGNGYGSGEPQNDFKPLTLAQEDAVKAVLALDAAAANLTFTEVNETTSVHATLRYAESDTVSTAWAYFPSGATTGGNVWFNNSTHWYDHPVIGNYAWLTMIHETGHALGLKHPHETMGSFGTMPVDHDSLEYSVMSYRSYIGASTSGGYTNAADSYPQTPMMYDIAALQRLYGANFFNQGQSSVYQWDPSTGQEFINGVGQGAPAGNKIFMTVWDGGGVNTYDFSNYATNVDVNLEPGAWTTLSSAQLANLGNGHYAAGNIANALLYNGNTASLVQNVIVGAGNDTVYGNDASNCITLGAGNDLIDGGGGTNTVVLAGAERDYQWTRNGDGSWTIADVNPAGAHGVDTLRDVQILQFADAEVKIGTASTVAITEPIPVAHDRVYLGAKHKVLLVGAANGVLATDNDANGDQLTAILLSKPRKGSLTLHANGSFVFRPPHSFVGGVSFKYEATDGVNSTVASVTIHIGRPHTATATGRGSMFDDQAPAPAHTPHHDHPHVPEFWGDAQYHGFADFLLY